MTTGKTMALTRWSFVSKVMSLLFNMLSRLVIAFLPRSKHFLISWLQSPSAVILEPKKIKSITVSIVSPSICYEVMGPDMWTTVLSNSMKLWAMPCRATQDGWVMVENSDKMWSTGERNAKPLQYSCLQNQIANIHWIIEIAYESSRKTSISASLTTQKPSTVWITTNYGKFLKRWEYQTTWPAS